MPFGWFAFVLLAGAGMAAFTLGYTHALNLEAQYGRHLRARAQTHAVFVSLVTLLPMLVGLILLAMLDGAFVRTALTAELPERLAGLPAAELEQYLDQLGTAASERGERLDDIFDEAARKRLLQLRGEARLAGAGLLLCLAGIGFWLGRKQQSPEAALQRHIETGLKMVFLASAGAAIFTTIGIVLSLAVESLRFFAQVPIGSFLFGLEWNAQTNQDFGAIPLFFGTLVMAFIAMAVAGPVGLYTAIYLAEYASPRLRRLIKPAMEILAGIPTVVYGFFAIIVVAPLVRQAALAINELPFLPEGFLAAQPTSALAAGLVMGIMIIPFVSSLADDVIRAVPQPMRDGAYALGATQSETIRKIVLPAALPGIIAAMLLAVSRAIGETMIVVMAAGHRAQITADPTSDITTITAQIVSLLTGDSAFDSPKTLSAFALGGVLFLITLFFNMVALRVVRHYQETYG